MNRILDAHIVLALAAAGVEEQATLDLTQHSPVPASFHFRSSPARRAKLARRRGC